MNAQLLAVEAEARGDKAAEAYWRRIASLVDLAPEFSPAQRDRLRVLLRPDPVPQSSEAA